MVLISKIQQFLGVLATIPGNDPSIRSRFKMVRNLASKETIIHTTWKRNNQLEESKAIAPNLNYISVYKLTGFPELNAILMKIVLHVISQREMIMS